MSILRNKVEKPNWGPFEYATLASFPLFSQKRWGKTVNWDILLEQAEQIKHTISLLIKTPFPTRLFSNYIDILDANISIFYDFFYYLVGAPFSDGIKGRSLDETWKRLQFWNIDCHETISKIRESLYISNNTFRCILQRYEIREINESLANYSEPYEDVLSAKISPDDESAYSYIKDIYGEKSSDQKVLASQIDYILTFLEQLAVDMFQWEQGFYSHCFLLGDFPSLLDEFENSERGRQIVQGWDYELGSSRGELIASLEKNKKFQPWVQKYLHLSNERNIIEELFSDDESASNIDYTRLYNTDNWISILSIAAILHEYNKRQEAKQMSENVSDESSNPSNQEKDETRKDPPPPDAVNLKFFDIGLFNTAERQDELRTIINDELSNINTSSGRDWFAFYAAYRYFRNYLSRKLEYVDFFSDIEALLPGCLEKINLNEQGDKRYKSYTTLLSREVDNWYVDYRKLPPINSLLYRSYHFKCSEKQFDKLNPIIKRVFNKLRNMANH